MDPKAQEELAEAPSLGVRVHQLGRAAFLLASEGGHVLADRGYERAGRLDAPSFSLAEEIEPSVASRPRVVLRLIS
jgi:hypothetical protein